jgi:ribosomal protein S18 acetylase RimI-like enzyme
MNAEEIIIKAEDPHSPDAVQLMNELSMCLYSITGDGGQSSFHVEDVCGPRSLFAIARNLKADAIGCGAFRPMDEKTAEVKRMYVRERSSGVGSMLLSFLERQAAQMGYETLRLETRLVNQGAVSFYERNGYRRIPNYGRYQGRPEAVCFEKALLLD